MTETDRPTSRASIASPTRVVLVPGLGLDARAWTAVRARLTGPSLVVTLPSMGRRAGRGTDLHADEQSRRLIAALPVTGDLILVGHSASCPVVVDAATRSSRVVGLVLIGPVTDPRQRSWPRMLVQWLRTATHEHLWEAPLLLRQYVSTGPTSMMSGMTQIRHYRTDLGLSRLAVPTHVIRGQQDRIASAGWCAQLATSGVTDQISVPAAGHMVPLTHPDVVAVSAERLRASHDGTPRPTRAAHSPPEPRPPPASTGH